MLCATKVAWLTIIDVNVYTKKSQWDTPTEPVYPPGEAPPDGPPPYAPGGQSIAPHKSEKSNLSSNNPYSSGAAGGRPSNDISEDERLARRLQEEEEARARGQHGDNRGAATDFYKQEAGSAQQPGQYGSYPPQTQGYGNPSYGAPSSSTGDKGSTSKGFLGKLLGKAGGHSSRPQGYPPQQAGYGYGASTGGYYGGQPGYGQSGYYPPAGGPMGMGGGMMGGGRRTGGGGMGVGSAAALGVGGGLLGGALLAEAADGGDHGGMVENNYYGDDGGDMGGDGGGDFGGDGGGGGDFGGGDF